MDYQVDGTPEYPPRREEIVTQWWGRASGGCWQHTALPVVVQIH